MFIWFRRSGETPRARFIWWPLLVGLAISVVLTVLVNLVL
jgi:hypothetical protein